MNSALARDAAGVVAAVVLASTAAWGADDARSAPSGRTTVPAASASRPTPGRVGAGKGPLPDPALLDGSTQPQEKKSEQGMIGEFELPGDENVRNGKVGGPQNQNASAGGQNSNTPMGMPQGGGGAQGQQQQQQGGGAQSAAGAQQQAGGAQQGGGAQGPENPNAAGKQIAGAGDPGAQAQGIQVAELGGAAGGDQSGAAAAGGPGEKPQQMAIGDSAMRIDPSQNAPGVVGAQQQVPAGHTQQHDKGTGSGGKGPAGGQGGNRVEKGRVIPAGL